MLVNSSNKANWVEGYYNLQ